MFDILETIWGAFVDWGRGESFRRSLLIGLTAVAVVATVAFLVWRRF